MPQKIIYHFDWNPDKARGNQVKHGVSFRNATLVFHDPLALTIYDDEHSEDEERWITIGLDESNRHLVVIHTFQENNTTGIRIRIISARLATKQEIAAYENVPG